MPTKLSLRSYGLARYALPLVVVGVAYLLREGLMRLAGGDLPPYITFYPAVAIVGLLGGFGPGLLATLTAALVTNCCILPPQGSFRIATLADALGLAVFSGMGVCLSVVFELYRRARQKLAAHEGLVAPSPTQEYPPRPSVERMVVNAGSLLSLALLAGVGWQIHRNLETATKANLWETHTYLVIQELDRLLSTTVDVETGQRGFIITGQERYLEPYNQARSQVENHMAMLKRLTQDHPPQQQTLARLEPVIREKLAELKETIELRRTQGFAAALAVVVTDKGKALMDQVRQHVAEAQDEEARLLQQRTAEKKRDVGRTPQALLASGTLAMLLLAGVFVFLKQENGRRVRAEAELRRHRDRLQEMVDARTADLTKANESLRQQREWLRVTLASIGDAVLVTDAAGRVTFVNPAAASLTGWGETEALGQPVQNVFRVINEQTREPADDVIRRVLDEGRTVALANHTDLVARDGREIPVEDSAAPIRDARGCVTGAVLVFHDVTRQRRDRELVRSAALFPEENPSPVLRAASDGTLLFANQSAAALLADWRCEVGKQTPAFVHQAATGALAGKVTQDLEIELGERSLSFSLVPVPERNYVNLYGRDVTEHKRAEAELRRANEELEQRVAERTAEVAASARYARSLIEASLDPLVTISPEGKITDVNGASAQATGVACERLIGTDFSDYFTEPGKAREGYRRVFAEGFVRDYPLAIRHASGRVTDVLYNATVYRNEAGGVQGVFAAARDITGRKRMEEELRVASRYARSLIEASLDPLVTISAEGKITDVNDASVQATGVARERLIGTDFSNYFTEPQRAREGYQRVFREGFVRDYPLAIRHVTGRATDVLYNATVYRNEAGGVQGVFAAARDVTERKRAEKEIRRYADDLRRSNQELEHFAYVASHDLQEPLRTVSSFSQLLARRYQGKLDADADDFIAFIVEGATRMQTLINDLLAFSRVGTRGNPFAPVRCQEILQGVKESLKAAIAESGAVISQDPLPTLVADQTQLAQLFQNLFSNAIKFRRPQEAPRIHVSALRLDDAWRLSVRDNGIGIDPQFFGRIFVLFQRLHEREQYPGTGIGLAICKKIVERHGGQIWVESEPGSGSTFHFTIPDDKTAYDQTRTTNPTH